MRRFHLVLVLLGCTGGNGDALAPTKRLYQTGCETDRDCEDEGVCRDRGTTTVCYPLCTEASCTTPDGSAGACEERACIPACAGSCPGELSCVAGRCLPAGTPPAPPRFEGIWAGTITGEADLSACGGMPRIETSTLTFAFAQVGTSVNAGVAGDVPFRMSGSVDGAIANLRGVTGRQESDPNCPPEGQTIDLACSIGEDASAQPLGIAMSCSGSGDQCGCPGGVPELFEALLSKQP